VNNPICNALNIRYPIIMGGMRELGTPPLAAAVSEAGGLGTLGAALVKPDNLREQIRLMKELTQKPFGVNIPVLCPYADHNIDLVIEEKVVSVTTAAGNPEQYTQKLINAGIYTMHVVPTCDLALKAQDAGVDAVIAEGGESGGYTSPENISTLVLVPRVVDSVRCPVVAAGGIGDGRGLAAALALGAVGVQMGTRFLGTLESEASHAYKAAMVMAKETDTLLAKRGFAFARGFKDEFLKKFTEATGDKVKGITAVGQIAGSVVEIVPVEKIITNMIDQAKSLLDNPIL
jgi:enoyl-[acyl-carrier protein] reductase II